MLVNGHMKGVELGFRYVFRRNHPLKIMFSYQLRYSTTIAVNNSVYDTITISLALNH